MKITYPASVNWIEEDDTFLVEFPGLPGCLTEGTTMEDALTRAQEALSGYLISVIDRGFEYTPQEAFPGAILIEPEAPVAFSLWLRNQRKKAGLTLTEVADRLGVRYQVYQKLENPATTNPTLRTLKKIEKVFGESLVSV